MKKQISGGVILLLLILTSCYDYSDSVYLDELDVTYTEYNPEADFSSYQTFAIRDCVVLVQNHWKDQEIEAFYAEGGGSDSIRNVLISAFEAIGFTYSSSLEDADVAINPVLMHLKYSQTVVYPPMYPPGWWWGYYPYYSYSASTTNYYPGWGWDGWYPWYGYSYTYKTGTLDLEMADAASIASLNTSIDGKSASEIKAMQNDLPQIELIWHALIDGYLSSNKDYNTQRAMRGITEALNQSPYLKR